MGTPSQAQIFTERVNYVFSKGSSKVLNADNEENQKDYSIEEVDNFIAERKKTIDFFKPQRNLIKSKMSLKLSEENPNSPQDSENIQLKKQVVELIRDDEHQPKKKIKNIKSLFYRKKRNFFAVDGIRIIAKEQHKLEKECLEYNSKCTSFLIEMIPRFLLAFLQKFWNLERSSKLLILEELAKTPGNVIFETINFAESGKDIKLDSQEYISRNVELTDRILWLIEGFCEVYQDDESICYDRILVRDVQIEKCKLNQTNRNIDAQESGDFFLLQMLKIIKFIEKSNYLKNFITQTIFDILIHQNCLNNRIKSIFLSKNEGFRFLESSFISNFIVNIKSKFMDFQKIMPDTINKIYTESLLMEIQNQIRQKMEILKKGELEKIYHLLLKREEGFFELLRSGIREYTFIYDKQFIARIMEVFQDQWTINKCKQLKKNHKLIEKYEKDFKNKAKQIIQMEILTGSQTIETQTSKEDINFKTFSNKIIEKKKIKSPKKNKKMNHLTLKRNRSSILFLEDLKEKNVAPDSMISCDSMRANKSANDKEDTSGENSGDPETDEVEDQILKKKKNRLIHLTNRKSKQNKSNVNMEKMKKMEDNQEVNLRADSYALMNVASIPYLSNKLRFENVYLEVYIEKPKTMDNVQVMLQEMWNQLHFYVKVSLHNSSGIDQHSIGTIQINNQE